MSAIVEVLNKMIERKKKIGNAIFFKQEVYFLYDERFLWSIKRIQWNNMDSRSDYQIRLYPNVNPPMKKSLFDYIEEQHISLEESHLRPFVLYDSTDYPTVAAHDTFKELYLIVSQKAGGTDDVFQAILNS